MQHECGGLEVSEDVLLNSCKTAMAAIDRVVPVSATNSLSRVRGVDGALDSSSLSDDVDSSRDGDTDLNEEAAPWDSAELNGRSTGGYGTDLSKSRRNVGGVAVLQLLMDKLEGFRNRVRPELIQNEIDKVSGQTEKPLNCCQTQSVCVA